MNAPCLFIQRLGVDNLETGARPTRMEIAREVAARHRMTVDRLRSESHSREVAWPRQEAMWEMGRHGYNRGEIGRTLNRTTWTVKHGQDAHAKRMSEVKGL